MSSRPADLSAVVAPGSVRAVHQFVPWLHPGDAVGEHTLQVRGVLRAAGLESEIFVEGAAPGRETEGRHFSEFPAYASGSVILYQFAVGSVMADYLFARPEPMAIWYHNLTPSSYFRAWEPHVADAMEWGRAQLRLLASRTALAIADSAFNEAELIDLEYSRTAVVPIFFDPTVVVDEPDSATLERLRSSDGGARWLFVGRLAPNKAQHDLIASLAAARAAYGSPDRLTLVGRPSSGRYAEALSRLVGALDLSGAVEIVDTGISRAELAAHYAVSSVLVCLSEHEGFCVPLLEAMANDVPIVAYGATAVTSTVGDAGIVLDSKRPSVVAAAVHAVISDRSLSERLVDAGRRRLCDFAISSSAKLLSDVLAPLTGLAA